MNVKIIQEWDDYFINVGLSYDLKEKYLVYIKKVLSNDIPIIFEFHHLCHLLGRTPKNLASIVNSSQNYYRDFEIKKRSGGTREITAPYPSLMEIQYWIYENILKTIKIHQCAHGFTHKKSIITNAKLHAGQDQLLKLDLKDFFPSISINRVISIFIHLGYPQNVSFYLAALCCYNGFLPQGAPTSPILSNIISFRLDKRLFSLAQHFDLKYTRYADDITFSGKNISVKILKYITSIIIDEGFEINQAKTKLFKNKSQRIVTGISVIDKEIKIPRDYKRKLKLELNFILKYGFESHVKKKRIRDFNYLEVIIGKVNFWLSVEPKNEYALMAKESLMTYYKNIPKIVL